MTRFRSGIDVNQLNIGDFYAQTYLTSMLSALGIPDVSGKSLYQCLVPDRLDNGTYGLSAINTAISNLAAVNASGEAKATYTYVTPWTDEQTIYEVARTTRTFIPSIWLDLSNMTQNGTIRVYYKVDGSNYRLIKSNAWVQASDPAGICIMGNFYITDYLKVTYQAGSSETTNRAIPYSIPWNVRE